MMQNGSLPPESPAQRSSELSATLLAQLAREMQLQLSPQQCAQLLGYMSLLQRWNQVHNLTAISAAHELLTHHLLDSLAIVRPLEHALTQYAGAVAPQHEAVQFLDAGTGAGLPGIALAVARPAWRGTLVDAVQKKCAFLQQVRIELHLTNVTVHHARIESSSLQAHELIVSRAFSSLREFVARTQGLLRPQGLWAAMKGRDPGREIADLPAGIEVLDTITLRVPMLREHRHLVILRQRATPPIGAATSKP